jgi:MYXO-CTERM domain-containing protein
MAAMPRPSILWSSLCAFALVTALGAPARAKTQPLAGAVPLPAGVTLRLPFAAGKAVRVSSGYGPAMGSSLHAGLAEASKANDHYALDLVYDGEPNNGKGLPILAALAGEVVRAGWATAGWANYGLRVIVRHDLGDGHVYHSIYCHLDSIDAAVTEGAMVMQGQPLGTLGQSCQGMPSCASFSAPHLHWALHRNSSIGGSGTGGSYGGNAVVPEPFDGAEDLVQGMVVTSTNSAMSVCGDGLCTAGEDPTNCPEDCPVCARVPAAGRIVDESEELCFERAGTPAYWHEEALGHAGSLLWTTATDAARADNVGTWRLDFEEAGSYAVDVYLEPGFAQAKKARYELKHGATDAFVIDQSAANGWVALGTVTFAAGGDQHVRLADNTGETLDRMRKLAFDALRLTRLDGGTGGGPGGTGGGASVAATGGATTGGGASSPASAPEGSDAGCGCRVARAAGAGRGAALLALAALAWLRRRRLRATLCPP